MATAEQGGAPRGITAPPVLGLQAIGEVLAACLQSLRVELMTAAATAAAAADLVRSALAVPLAAELRALVGGAVNPPTGDISPQGPLSVLLRLYSGALAVHARCAALQPQILSLPGQGTMPARARRLHADAPNAGLVNPLALGSESGAFGDWFAALYGSSPEGPCERGASPPTLTVAAAAILGPGSADARRRDYSPATRLAVVHSVAQRAGVLHERWLRARYCCPLVTLADEAASPASALEHPPAGYSLGDGAAGDGAVGAESMPVEMNVSFPESSGGEGPYPPEDAVLKGIERELRELARLLLTPGLSLLPWEQEGVLGAWDGVVAGVSEAHFGVAAWSVLVGNIGILAPFLESFDLQSFLERVLESAAWDSNSSPASYKVQCIFFKPST